MIVAPIAGAGGRALLALLFVLAGITKLAGPRPFLEHMARAHLPGVLLPVVALFEIGAGGALLLDWNMRLAAGFLGAFCVATASCFTCISAIVRSGPSSPRTSPWPARLR